MKNIFEIFKKKGGEEKPDYGSLPGLPVEVDGNLRELPERREVVLTNGGMGQKVIVRPGPIVGGKSNG